MPCNNVVLSFLDKLRPAVLEKYEWAGLKNHRRFIGVTAFCVTCLTIDCNNFFMKFVMFVPAEHDMLKWRVALWGMASLAIAKEWHEFISNQYCHRLGTFAWLAFYTAGVEVLLVIRSSRGLFTEPFPWYVKVIWTVIIILYSALLYISFRNGQRNA